MRTARQIDSELRLAAGHAFQRLVRRQIKDPEPNTGKLRVEPLDRTRQEIECGRRDAGECDLTVLPVAHTGQRKQLPLQFLDQAPRHRLKRAPDRRRRNVPCRSLKQRHADRGFERLNAP